MAGGWSSGVALGRPCGTTGQAEHGATGQGGESVGQGRRGPRLHDRRVDLAARGGGDRAADWCYLSPRLCLVPLAQATALELAAAGSAGTRARRGRDRAVGQGALAAVEKRSRRQHALIVFEDESGVSLLLSVRATWAPRGHTPVLRHRFCWKRLSLAAALVLEPDATDAHLVFQLRPGAYNGETLIEFLTDLHQLEPGRRMLLLWDGLPGHRSRCMTDWINEQRSRLSVERLPAYAPEVNPTEQVFGNLKSTELANLCRDTIAEVQRLTEDGLHRIGNDARLCFAFLRHSGLTL